MNGHSQTRRNEISCRSSSGVARTSNRHRDAVGITIYITDIQLVLELRSSIPFSPWRSSYAISIHDYHAERRGPHRRVQDGQADNRKRRRGEDEKYFIVHAGYICFFLFIRYTHTLRKKCCNKKNIS